LGQTSADVARVFDSGRYRTLRVQLKTPAEWRIAAPSQIGGSEWLLRLYFEDGRLRTVRVGSGIRPTSRPGRSTATIASVGGQRPRRIDPGGAERRRD
jgi:hypothetical protein